MASWEQRASDAERNGDTATDQSKYIEAALHYTEAIKILPGVYHLYMKRAKAFLQMEHHSLALQDIILYIQRTRNNPEGYIMKAEIEHSAQHYKKAVESYNIAKEKAKDAATKKKIENGLKQSNEALKEQLSNESRRPLLCLAVSFALAAIILLVDARVLVKPLLRHSPLVQVAVAIFICVIGYGIGLMTNWIIESDRNSLLEAPIDLLNFGDDLSTTSTKDHNSTDRTRSNQADRSHTKSD